MRGTGGTGGWAGLIAALAVLALPSGAAGAGQTLLNDAFSGATTSSPVLAEPNPATSSTGLPCLTAGGDTTSQPVPGCGMGEVADPAGSGVMMLTGDSPSKDASLIYNGTFPTSAGLDVTFDSYEWPTGGDGISFDLAAAPPVPTAGGGGGGALGYTGFPFGYLGIGLDVFGNFTNPLTDGAGCTDPSWASSGVAVPNQVVVRGPGTSSGLEGYCLVAGTDGVNPDPIDVSGISLGSDTDTRTGAQRGVHIQIDPSAGTFAIGIDPSGGTTYIPILSGPLPTSYFDPATGTSVAGLPPTLTFAFSGATGEAAEVNEISNVNVATLDSGVPALSLTASDGSGGLIKPGGSVTYRLTAGLSASSPAPEIRPTTMVITDPLPAGETLAGTPAGAGWNCSASTSAQVSCVNTSTSTVARGGQLPPVSVPVTVSPSATTAITDTATVSSADAAPVSAGDTLQLITSTGGRPATTSVSVSCSPATVLIGAVSTCTATVSDGGLLASVSGDASTTPSGTVQFVSDSGHFANGGVCTLAAVAGQSGTAACDSDYTADASGPVSAEYVGDLVHATSTSTTGVATAPVAGKTVTAQVNSGTVLIHIPGRSGYQPLSNGAFSIPVGATVDALNGSVTIDTAGDNLPASNQHHVVDSGTFAEGLFAVKQAATAAKEKQRGTELVLETPPGAVVHAACHRKGPPGKGVVRTLNGVVKGVYHVVGAASTMDMSSGSFIVQDRCDGTLTKVRKGKARVSFKKKVGRHTRTVTRTLHAGQELLAKERFLADTLASS
jgi:large repetitive protein